MAKSSKDLNRGDIDVERWNRMDQIVRLIGYAQTYISYGDINQDIPSMYQGAQMMLDTITPDFEEVGKNDNGFTVTLRGIKTKRFLQYRLLLDQSMSLFNRSRDASLDLSVRSSLRNGAYRKLQVLKYSLLQECDRLGYNAKKSNSADTYRDGNQQLFIYSLEYKYLYSYIFI